MTRGTSILDRLHADLAATGVGGVEGSMENPARGPRVSWRLTGGATPLEAWVSVPGDSEAAAVEAAGCLQDLLMRDGRVTGSAGWPACPRHLDHPLTPRVSDGVAVWSCDRDDDIRPLGGLPAR